MRFHDLHAAQSMLGWDLEVMMPEKSASIRAKQISTLTKVSHEKLTGVEMARALGILRQPGADAGLGTLQKALVHEVGRNFDKSCKIPVDLLQEMVETTTTAHAVWVEARAEHDFRRFAPLLGKIVALNRRMADALGYEDSPYDALLEEYEPDLRVRQLDALFAQLKSEIVPLLRAIRDSGYDPDAHVLTQGFFPAEKQMAFSRQVLAQMGFDFEAGRLDLSTHPFTSGSGVLDVRLTTRIDEHDVFSSLGSSMHEAGHGIYEQGVNPDLARTPLAEGTSLGIHESQSRLWENQIGRSRAFWRYFFPRLQQQHFPAMQSVSPDQFFHAVNRVHSSLIRVDADEVTYNLHIMVRYEIEKALIEGTMSVSDIPEAWNAKYEEYLGITPANDAEGCLQDIHWSHGSFGYFPTYTLGNLYAAQFFSALKKQTPDWEVQVEHGHLRVIKEWLNREIHWVGKVERAHDIVRRVTGEALNARHFTDYLWEKFSGIYPISPSERVINEGCASNQ